MIGSYQLNIHATALFVTAFFVIAIGIFVIYRNFFSLTHRYFFISCMSIFAWLTATAMGYISMSPAQAVFWFKIDNAGAAFVAPSFFGLSIYIAELGRKFRKVLIFGFIMSLIFAILGLFFSYFLKGVNVHYWGFFPEWKFINSIPFFLFWFGYSVASFMVLLKTHRETLSLSKKNQIKFVILAFAIAYIGSVDYLPTFGFNIYPFGFIPIILFVSIIAYAIVRHQLMDIRVAVSRGAIFFFVYTFLLGGIIFAGLKGQDIYIQKLGISWWIYFVFAGAVVTYIAQQIYHFLSTKAKDLILKEQLQYQEALSKISENLMFLRDRKKIYEMMVESVSKEIKITHVRIFLHDEKSEEVFPPKTKQDIRQANIAKNTKNYRLVAYRGKENREQEEPEFLLDDTDFYPEDIKNSTEINESLTKGMQSTVHAFVNKQFVMPLDKIDTSAHPEEISKAFNKILDIPDFYKTVGEDVSFSPSIARFWEKVREEGLENGEIRSFNKALLCEIYNIWNMSVDDEDKLIWLLSNAKEAVLCENLDSSPLVKGMSQSEIKTINIRVRSLGASVVVPIVGNEGLFGFMSLGGKPRGRIYSEGDMHVLKTVSNNMAMALKNADFYTRMQKQEAALAETFKLSVLGELAAGFAHQVNNPMTGIMLTAANARATADMKLRDIAFPQGIFDKVWDVFHHTAESLNLIEKRAEYTGNLVSTMMRFSKPGEKKEENVQELIKRGLSLIPEGKMERANVHISPLDVEEDVPSVYVRTVDIEQVLMNLVINAVEAMQKKGGGLIKVRAYRDIRRPGYVRMEVSDMGTGMTKKERNNIFAAFYTTKGAHGTGIGLTLAKRLVEGNDGFIELDTQLGIGTTFKIYLPVCEKRNEEKQSK